ncbi:MAG: hypothetical protein M1827_003535 [Pycnora praestabilis]|nr:MAG: hypothetical protein M1827_003535 [Pycnora praestabilis]
MFIQLVPYLSLAIFGLPTTAFHSSSSAPSSAEAELIARFYPAEPICRGPRAVVNLQSTGLAWMEFRGFLMARLQQQQEELDQGDEILPADGSHLASIVRSFVVGLEGLPQRTGDERVGLPLAWASDSCGITIDITPDAESERASIDDIDAAVQAIRNTCVKPTLYMDFKGQLGTGGMTTTGEDQKLRVSIYGVSKELVGEQPVLTDTSIPGFDGMTLGEQGKRLQSVVERFAQWFLLQKETFSLRSLELTS